jgi:hypothetical protein
VAGPESNGRVRQLSAAALLVLVALMGCLLANADAAPRSPERCAPVAPSAAALPTPEFDDGPMIARADLLADFDAWLAGMRRLSPDLSIRSDIPRLDQEAARIRRSLVHPMSRREAWLHFARLNPYLRDGHNAIYMPNYRSALEAHVRASGHIVPIEVRFAPDGSLRVFSVAPGTDRVKPEDLVLSINGHSVRQMMHAMLALSPGDTPASQRAWAVRRFAMLYWYLYGDTREYDLRVRSELTGCSVLARLAGATTLPQALQPDPKPGELFGWRILRGNIGYLRVDTFDPDQAQVLARVARAAFTQFKRRDVKALIIDVRENGGGDDPLWQKDLMEYITDKPYAQLSHYKIRITKREAGPGDVIGAVQEADYSKRFTPNRVDPIRFHGPVYILVGPYSFSATIQFVVAAQDFGIAKIAGEETAALSCQTGKYEQIHLPRTGLAAFTPVIAYTRPSGRGCGRGVVPNVPITTNEVEPENTLSSLVSRVKADLRIQTHGNT